MLDGVMGKRHTQQGAVVNLSSTECSVKFFPPSAATALSQISRQLEAEILMRSRYG
jgi:hypothetical protein